MEWTKVEFALPKCNRKKGSHGVPVLVWPYREPLHPGSDRTKKVMMAYYGKRVVDEGSFYLHGAVLHEVTHWMYLPEKPQ